MKKIINIVICFLIFLLNQGCHRRLGNSIHWTQIDSIQYKTYTAFPNVASDGIIISEKDKIDDICQWLSSGKEKIVKMPPNYILVLYYKDKKDTLLINGHYIKHKGSTFILKKNMEEFLVKRMKLGDGSR